MKKRYIFIIKTLFWFSIFFFFFFLIYKLCFFFLVIYLPRFDGLLLYADQHDLYGARIIRAHRAFDEFLVRCRANKMYTFESYLYWTNYDTRIVVHKILNKDFNAHMTSLRESRMFGTMMYFLLENSDIVLGKFDNFPPEQKAKLTAEFFASRKA